MTLYMENLVDAAFNLLVTVTLLNTGLKVLHCSEMKYVKIIYNTLHNDCINFPNKVT